MTAGDPVTPTIEYSNTSRTRRRFGSRRRGDQRGAALVEFALIATPLFMILFGTIEFGWAFFQLNDIRHGAREGIRLVAVASDVNPAYIASSTSPPVTTNGERLAQARSEEHTSELQSLMRISYAVFCLKKKRKPKQTVTHYY